MLPTRKQLIHEMQAYAQASTARGVALFVFDVALYVVAITGVLLAPGAAWKIACIVFAGMALARMFSLAHNAAHENIVRGKKLNRLMAVVLFTPFFYNYRLWAYEHHMLHHPHPNNARPDAYTPLSKREYDALPRWRRALERFYRAPNLVGWGVYYLLQRHWSTKIFPRAWLPDRLQRAAWLNTALLGAYGVAFLTLLAAAPRYAVGLDSVSAVLLGLVVPFFVFEIHDGFALYVQHTDPSVPWFARAVDRNGEGRTELLSVHLVVPRVMGWFYHDTFSHPVHHLHPKIPCYRVYRAQCHLDRLLGDAAVAKTMSVRWLRDTMRCCKLYDWDRHQWLGFDGFPTTEPLPVMRFARFP